MCPNGRNDILDIIAYVRMLKPIENKVPAAESDSPMSFIINTMSADNKGGNDPTPPIGSLIGNTSRCLPPVSGMSENDPGVVYEYLRTRKPAKNTVHRFGPKDKLVANR
ncbi:hypothetical protein GCM10027085_40880 [Spirosoma aerophilum]